MRVVMAVLLAGLGLAHDYCDSGYHSCVDEDRCVDNYRVCDGTPDCQYEDDEVNCKYDLTTEATTTETTTRGNSCPESQYECENGLCIPDTWVCDGVTDCPDSGDDEHGCSKADTLQSTYCERGYHECYFDYYQCIDNYRVCDGIPDCYHGDEEKNCRRSTTTTTTETTTRGNSCAEGQYECASGLCIPDTWVCDGVTDCPDGGDDEHGCSKADTFTSEAKDQRRHDSEIRLPGQEPKTVHE